LITATADGQHPMAVVLSCIDSRSPAEIIFDLSLGDIFSVRVAGNVLSRKVLGSIEYSCAVAGAKLVLVLGHTRCGAVTAALKLLCSQESPAHATGCQHLQYIIDDLRLSVDHDTCLRVSGLSDKDLEPHVKRVARRNVVLTVGAICSKSATLDRLVSAGRIAIVGGLYDVATGKVEFLERDAVYEQQERVQIV